MREKEMALIPWKLVLPSDEGNGGSARLSLSTPDGAEGSRGKCFLVFKNLRKLGNVSNTHKLRACMTNDSIGPDTPSTQFRKQTPKHPSPRGPPTARGTSLFSVDWASLWPLSLVLPHVHPEQHCLVLHVIELKSCCVSCDGCWAHRRQRVFICLLKMRACVILSFPDVLPALWVSPQVPLGARAASVLRCIDK